MIRSGSRRRAYTRERTDSRTADSTVKTLSGQAQDRTAGIPSVAPEPRSAGRTDQVTGNGLDRPLNAKETGARQAGPRAIATERQKSDPHPHRGLGANGYDPHFAPRPNFCIG